MTEQASRPGAMAVDRLVVRLIRAQTKPFIGSAARLLLVLLGVHVPAAVRIGGDLLMPHATGGVVIHPQTTIGDRVTIYHGVTIGRADGYVGAHPEYAGVEIGDDAVLCAGAVVLGRNGEPTRVGHGTVIGANAVLSASTGDHEVWAGNPARKVADRV